MSKSGATRVQRLTDDLCNLKCPFVNAGSKDVYRCVEELIEGKDRDKLVDWILLKYDPNLPSYFKFQDTDSTSSIHSCTLDFLSIIGQETMIGMLGFIPSAIPLSSLLEGKGSKEQQLEFLENLIQWATISRLNEFLKSELLMENISREYSKVFSTDPELLSEEQQIALQTSMITPNLTELKDSLNTLKSTLDSLSAQLEDLSHIVLKPEDPNEQKETNSMMESTLFKLKSQIQTFNHTFITEIKPWTSQPQLDLDTRFDDLITRVSSLYESCASILQSFHILKSSYGRCVSAQKIESLASFDQLGEKATGALSDSINILETALKRRQRSISSK